MAYANATLNISNGFSARINGAVSELRDRIARRRMFNQTVRELNALTDRELADLGLHRSMIASIARDAAYAAN